MANKSVPVIKNEETPARVVATAAAPTPEEIDEIQSRHIKGCNCKKSNCLKRYCECYLVSYFCGCRRLNIAHEY